ncbi:hypothetical protein [Rhodothermus marinus]|uniref:hypothetical protein n=2 Tax=Pseudomonadati TaxID=3379134 RepID=UPI00067682BD|nr:hypothetical protein [Rhodothermus marinus]
MNMNMKRELKKHLTSLGVYRWIYPLLKLPLTFRWIQLGCQSPPPHLVKLYTLRAYAKAFGLRVFIETGTYLGDTAEWMARMGMRVYTIELDETLFKDAQLRLQRYRNVTVMWGDSGEILPKLLSSEIREPALFWLDAHYSGGITARGTIESPIESEISAILHHNVKGHVILIDDARHFTGSGGYPHLDELLHRLRVAFDGYSVEVSTDIIL